MKIPFDDFTKVILSSDKYFVSGSFNTKMVPLRSNLEAFGFNVSWNGEAKIIKVSNASVNSGINMNTGIYSLNKQNVMLESAPIIANGITVVPISYFTDILNIPYSIDNDGTITFYKF